MEDQQNHQQKEHPSITSISVISGLIWLILATLLILFVQEKTMIQVLLAGDSIIVQLLTGMAAGGVFGAAGALMVRFPHIKAVLEDYHIIKQLKELKLNNSDILQVSFVAGVTEEILFRGAIQPIIGIWLTSLLFVAIHGYIRFKTVWHILFTLFTFLLSMVLGWLTIYFGLISAITAHAVYDLIVLWKFRDVFQR
jgi:uncharacterized protein